MRATSFPSLLGSHTRSHLDTTAPSPAKWRCMEASRNKEGSTNSSHTTGVIMVHRNLIYRQACHFCHWRRNKCSAQLPQNPCRFYQLLPQRHSYLLMQATWAPLSSLPPCSYQSLETTPAASAGLCNCLSERCQPQTLTAGPINAHALRDSSSSCAPACFQPDS